MPIKLATTTKWNNRTVACSVANKCSKQISTSSQYIRVSPRASPDYPKSKMNDHVLMHTLS